jgi:hypothetical protein
MTVLSDGAFKLYVFLCLRADRSSARLEVDQSNIAKCLAKSRRSVITYFEELCQQGICDAVLPRNCHGDTGGAGGHRRRPSLHVQPGHRQQGLILRLQAVSRCDLLPRPCSAPALQGSWSLPESSKQGGTS